MQNEQPENPSNAAIVAQYVASTYHDGDLLTHDQLKLLCGLRDPDLSNLDLIEPSRRTAHAAEVLRKAQFEYMENVESLREELLRTHRIALDNVRAKGYRLVPVKEQTSVAMSGLKRDTGRAVRKCHSLLVNVRVELLDESGRRENTDALARLSFFADRSTRALVS